MYRGETAKRHQSVAATNKSIRQFFLLLLFSNITFHFFYNYNFVHPGLILFK